MHIPTLFTAKNRLDARIANVFVMELDKIVYVVPSISKTTVTCSPARFAAEWEFVSFNQQEAQSAETDSTASDPVQQQPSPAPTSSLMGDPALDRLFDSLGGMAANLHRIAESAARCAEYLSPTISVAISNAASLPPIGRPDQPDNSSSRLRNSGSPAGQVGGGIADAPRSTSGSPTRWGDWAEAVVQEVIKLWETTNSPHEYAIEAARCVARNLQDTLSYARVADEAEFYGVLDKALEARRNA